MAIPSDVLLATTLLLWLTIGASSQALQVPCFFIFGDSLNDNGNNNGILTLARANYSPYGIDFPRGATGRFTNGRTVVDVLAQLLGSTNFVPSYASARGPAILGGLNYASGAAGIRDETGYNLGGHFSMNQQLEHFRTTLEQMRLMLGGNETALELHLNKCIYFVGMGNNDYLNNYFMPTMYATSKQYTPRAYADVLLQDYSLQLTELYKMGARKVVVTAASQIGCTPYTLAQYNRGVKSGRCNEEMNSAVSLFNSGLLKLVNFFNSGQLPGSKFVYLNAYKNLKDIFDNAAGYGFDVVDNGCCGAGRNNGQLTCLPLFKPCTDRQKYIFWDPFHPTEAVNIIVANTSYGSKSKEDVHPINIQQLALATL